MSDEKEVNNELSKEDQVFNDMVDEFIKLANKLAQNDSVDNVGAAMRYSTSRYAAFEASEKSDDLRRDKKDATEWFANEFSKMLDVNFDDYIEYYNSRHKVK